MSGNTFGTLFTVTSFGESHGPAIGCVVDGCPPGLALCEADIQAELDRRKPGTSRHVTQRREPDTVEILSGVFEGKTTGTPVGLLIRNQDQRSKDYGNIAETFRPGHADYTYTQKYGFRDYRGGGRSSARETAVALSCLSLSRYGLNSSLPGLALTIGRCPATIVLGSTTTVNGLSLTGASGIAFEANHCSISSKLWAGGGCINFFDFALRWIQGSLWPPPPTRPRNPGR